jgi:N6-L-threonylcarbamoyladenine synthase
VTVGPGLEPALWTGINFAKFIGNIYKKPVLGGNHLEGHLYSSLLSHKEKVKLPAIALIVSGGHTMVLRMDKLSSWKKIGETRDDAAGEAFDKVARLLGLPYPGGPEVEKMAKLGNENAIQFPRPMLTHKNYDFSFSGLKTSVLYYLRDNPRAKKADIAASFQKAAVDVLVKKTLRATDEFGAETIILGGGVAANKYLKNHMSKEAKRAGVKFIVPNGEFNTDNAAMIATSSYINHLKKKKYRLIAQANLNM